MDSNAIIREERSAKTSAKMLRATIFEGTWKASRSMTELSDRHLTLRERKCLLNALV